MKAKYSDNAHSLVYLSFLYFLMTLILLQHINLPKEKCLWEKKRTVTQQIKGSTHCLKSACRRAVHKSTPWQQPGANAIHVSLTEHAAMAWSWARKDACILPLPIFFFSLFEKCVYMRYRPALNDNAQRIMIWNWQKLQGYDSFSLNWHGNEKGGWNECALRLVSKGPGSVLEHQSPHCANPRCWKQTLKSLLVIQLVLVCSQLLLSYSWGYFFPHQCLSEPIE